MVDTACVATSPMSVVRNSTTAAVRSIPPLRTSSRTRNASVTESAAPISPRPATEASPTASDSDGFRTARVVADRVAEWAAVTRNQRGPLQPFPALTGM